MVPGDSPGPQEPAALMAAAPGAGPGPLMPPVYRGDQSDASRPAPRRARPGSTAPEVPRVAMGTRRGRAGP